MSVKSTIDRRDATPEALAHVRVDVGGFGTLWLAFSSEGLCEVTLPGGVEPAPARVGAVNASMVSEACVLLENYFAGQRVDFSAIRLDLRGTEFQRRVWAELQTIPHGAVATYKSIAAAIGRPRGGRAVGMANARNPIPIIVPCHRVVETGRTLGGFSGGVELKRKLLALEGVAVDGERVLPGQLELL